MNEMNNMEKFGGEYGYFYQSDIDEIINKGGRRWTKYDRDRIYIKNLIYTVGGLSIEKYNTGNIARAEINGENIISNGETRRLLVATEKMYIDLKTGAICSEKYSLQNVSKQVIKSVTDYVESLRHNG